MKLKQALAGMIAASLVATPVVAQAAAVSASRTAAPVGDAENIQGGWLIPALALLAIILGLVVIFDGDGEDLPHSP